MDIEQTQFSNRAKSSWEIGKLNLENWEYQLGKEENKLCKWNNIYL